jgi:hypothetical protein
MGDPEYQRKYGMETVETKIVNIHGSLEENEDDVYETQELVVATAAMPAADWRRARAFSWMAALLHFDKVLQIPLVVLHETTGTSYRELVELFLEGPGEDLPVLREVRDFFLDKARDIQTGGPEYCRGKEWLNIWWPADEYLLITLCTEGKLEAFYREASALLGRFLRERFLDVPADLVHEAVALNRSLLKQPFQHEDLDVRLSYNLYEVYRAALVGEEMPIVGRPDTIHVDRTSAQWHSWDEWCREVIWYGNKKGAYLYGNGASEVELAGHF